MAVVLSRVKDKATGQLASGISAATLSIPLGSGEGALFPQPYTGTASSAGSSTVLNDTGDLAGLAVGDFVRNVTDGSWAFVVTAGTNSITTTKLKGGTDNTWDSGDTWRSSEFVVTIAAINASGVDTAYEEALIVNRSTDTLTVATGGRGYNSTTAQSFSASDYVQLRVVAPNLEEVKSLLKEFNQTVDTATTDIATAQTDITAQKTGSYHYVVTTGSADAYVAATPALAAYAAGNLIVMKANFTNTGAATINLNGLGAKSIKKNDGATALSANDIVSGQIVVLRYDGTNFQMLSPVGTPATAAFTSKTVYLSGTSSAAIGTSSTSVVDFDTHQYTIDANFLTNTTGYRFSCAVDTSWTVGEMTFYVYLGSTALLTAQIIPVMTANRTATFSGFLVGTAAAGAAVAVRGMVQGTTVDTATHMANIYNAANFATNGSLLLKFAWQYGTSNAGHGAIMTMCHIERISSSALA